MKTIFVILLALLPLPAYSENKPTHTAASPMDKLSPEIKSLLTREMQLLEKGLQSAYPAYISANWQEVAKIADKMQNSYIFKQSLSEAQKKQLHASLPTSFIKLDHHFHYLAGMLKHVAEHKKPELVGFYLSKMTETCVECHAQFASHKFPGFTADKKAEHSH